MTAQTAPTPPFIAEVLGVLDVKPLDRDRFTAVTGPAAGDGRQVVEGSQVLAQAIIAVAHRFPTKSVRSAHAVFARVVLAGSPIELDIDVVSEGRSTATAVVSVTQNGKRCVTVTILTDVPTADVIRHQSSRPDVVGPAEANPSGMPVMGDGLRFVDVLDVNSPDEVGPPELYAWFRCGPVPGRDALAKALLTIFTGWFGIATTMRAHEGIGARQAHTTVSTAPMTLSVSFHEAVRWVDWLLYTHESLHAGAGMSYVRGTVHALEGALIASFIQEALVRPMRTADTSIDVASRM